VSCERIDWSVIVNAGPAGWRARALCSVIMLLTTSPAKTAHAAPAFEAPALGGHVNDYAQVLSTVDARRLEARLTAFEATTGHQFALLTVRSLNGVPLEQYSIKVAEAWQLGSNKGDNGLIMVIATGDRNMRIEVGYGLEGAIPDAIAARVIRETLAPAFRRREFAAGIDAGFGQLIDAANGGVRLLQRRFNAQASEQLPWKWLLLPLLLPLLVLWILGGGSVPRNDPAAIRSRRSRLIGRGSVASDELGFSGGGSSNSAGSFSSSAGGVSGGGGDFGGGGASGSW
jgi:uncharacterized protein